MRQETRIEQTCKLILLGFPKPYGTEEHQQLTEDGWVTISETAGNYTIGQLLDFLPATATQHIRYVATKKAWTISFCSVLWGKRTLRGWEIRPLPKKWKELI